MTFHVRITLHDICNKSSKSIIAIGETIYINNDGNASILTK